MQRIHATIAVSAFALFAMAAATTAPAQAQTEIQWWHAMSGANNETVENLAKEFNASQSEYKVVPVYKGTYPETLNAASPPSARGSLPTSSRCSTSAPAS